MKRLNLVILVGLVIGLCTVAVGAAPLKIGISKFVEHPALDAVEQGIIDALTAAGYERDVDVEYLLSSAQADYAVGISIAQTFQAQNVDLVVAIATPTAQAAVEVYRGSDVPVIYAACTDPVGAGLVLSATDPSGNENVTGVSDMIPVAAHLSLLKDLLPNLAKVGIIYNAGEANSVTLTNMALDAAPALGIEIITATADSTANVPLAAQSLVGRVDAYYVTTDNTVVSAIDSVLAASQEAGVPFLVADPTSIGHATVAAGFDYYVHGTTVGDVIDQVLSGALPNEIPMTLQADAEIHLNHDLAAGIGYAFPESIVAQAASLVYSGATFTK